MNITKEELEIDSLKGNDVASAFKKQINELLLAERMARRKTVAEVGAKTGISTKQIEKLEFSSQRVNWAIVAKLLGLYKKTVAGKFSRC